MLFLPKTTFQCPDNFSDLTEKGGTFEHNSQGTYILWKSITKHIESFYRQPLGTIRFSMIFIYECAIFSIKWLKWCPSNFLEHADHN